MNATIKARAIVERISGWYEGHEAGSPALIDELVLELAAALAGPGEGGAAPWGYIVVDSCWDGVEASGRTLREAVEGLDSPDWGRGWIVAALIGTERRAVPREAYAEPNPPTPEDAMAFIRRRAEKIASGSGLATIMGIGRCNPDDDEDKQIADYIRTAAWKVRVEPDEEWWCHE